MYSQEDIDHILPPDRENHQIRDCPYSCHQTVFDRVSGEGIEQSFRLLEVSLFLVSVQLLSSASQIRHGQTGLMHA